jgi:hypothetical protein
MAVNDSGAGAGPAGFGSGCKREEEVEIAGGEIGGRRNEITGDSAVEPTVEDEGINAGGLRRTGTGGVREGRTIRVVSRFGAFGGGEIWSPFGGSVIGTVSFFGSGIGGCLGRN